jgi:transcriptional regulator with XRE-family HTH domain
MNGQRNRDDLLYLGRAIGELRRQRRMTGVQLADACGVHRTRIYALEAGRVNPGYTVLLALSRGLGVSVSELIAKAEALTAEQRRPEQDG